MGIKNIYIVLSVLCPLYQFPGLNSDICLLRSHKGDTQLCCRLGEIRFFSLEKKSQILKSPGYTEQYYKVMLIKCNIVFLINLIKRKNKI